MTEHILASDLRNSVLQFAFSGKLTERKLNDSSVETFLLKCSEIRNKCGTKHKPLSDIESYDTFFDIPNEWSWAYVGDIFMHNAGKALNSKNTKGTKRKYITTSNIYADHFELDNLREMYYTEDEIEKYSVKENDLLVLEGGDYGRTALWNLKESYCIQNHVHRLRPYYDVVIKYFFYLLSFYKESGYIKGKGIAIQGLSSNALHEIIIPIPPIEEQQRIVDKVDELMAKIDEYEKLENQLVELKKDFPTNMKDSILQAAMQGKLTKRFKSDTTVEIDNEFDSIDIEIPSEWKIAKYHSVCEINTGLTFNKSNQCQKSNSALRILRGGNINDNFEYVLKDDDVYVTYTDKYIRLKIGDIISPAVTSMEKMCKVGYIDKELENTTAGGFVYIYSVKDTNVLNPRFLMYFICSKFNKDMCIPNIHKSGQAFYNLKKTGLIQQPIVIPPIEEQQRIVELLDRVLPLCDQLQEVI